MKNIRINEKQDASMQQGESCLKYVIAVFLALCWLCKADAGSEALESVTVHKFQVAAVGNRTYGKAPCVESYIPFLAVGECHD